MSSVRFFRFKRAGDPVSATSKMRSLCRPSIVVVLRLSPTIVIDPPFLLISRSPDWLASSPFSPYNPYPPSCR